MKFITKQYIIDNIGKYAYLSTKETYLFSGYFGGIITSFNNDILKIDDEISINYKDIVSLSIENIH